MRSGVRGKSSKVNQYLMTSACCVSCSWTFRHTSPAVALTLPILVKRAPILSLRRKPAARRFNRWLRHASMVPGGEKERALQKTPNKEKPYTELVIIAWQLKPDTIKIHGWPERRDSSLWVRRDRKWRTSPGSNIYELKFPSSQIQNEKFYIHKTIKQ